MSSILHIIQLWIINIIITDVAPDREVTEGQGEAVPGLCGVSEAVTADVSAAEDVVTVEAHPVLADISALPALLLDIDGVWEAVRQTVHVGTPGQWVHTEPTQK